LLKEYYTIVKRLLNDCKMIVEGCWTVVKRLLTIDNRMFNSC